MSKLIRTLLHRLRLKLRRLELRLKKINEEAIMTYVMATVVFVTAIVVTIAWWANNNHAVVSAMTLKVGDNGVIALSLESGDKFVDIDEVRENHGDDTFTVISDELTAVDFPKLAPGTMGHFTVYVKWLSEAVNRAEINLTMAVPDTGGYSPSAPTEVKTQVSELVKGHFKFYQSRVVNGETVKSEIEITEEAPLSIGFTAAGDEIPVTIYWEWVYEYEELQDTLKTRLSAAYQNPEEKENKKLLAQYFDSSKIGSPIPYSFTELYDYGDTLIGNNVNSLQFRIDLRAGYDTETG